MRRMLRDLENGRRTQTVSKRSLKFGNEKSNDELFNQMNDILQKSKSSKNELLEQEKNKNVELEKEVETLKTQLMLQTQELKEVKTFLSELKSTCLQGVEFHNQLKLEH